MSRCTWYSGHLCPNLTWRWHWLLWMTTFLSTKGMVLNSLNLPGKESTWCIQPFRLHILLMLLKLCRIEENRVSGHFLIILLKSYLANWGELQTNKLIHKQTDTYNSKWTSLQWHLILPFPCGLEKTGMIRALLIISATPPSSVARLLLQIKW